MNVEMYFCGRLAPCDAPNAAAVIERFGGTAKATKAANRTVHVVGYFPGGLTHQQRLGIASTMANEGIYAL